MTAVVAAMLVVPALDEALKRWVRRRNLPTVSARLWIMRVGGTMNRRTVWVLWTLAAVVLGAASIWLPATRVPAGLVLGGSLSNVLESSIRGRVTDYVDVGFWPVFNLADVALTAGTIGLAMTLLAAARQVLA